VGVSLEGTREVLIPAYQSPAFVNTARTVRAMAGQNQPLLLVRRCVAKGHMLSIAAHGAQQVTWCGVRDLCFTEAEWQCLPTPVWLSS
jgi:hypothetical protein